MLMKKGSSDVCFMRADVVSKGLLIANVLHSFVGFKGQRNDTAQMTHRWERDSALS